MSIATIVTRGYGSFGSIGDVTRAGYESAAGAGEVVTPPVTVTVQVGDGGPSWQDYVEAKFKKNHVLQEIQKEEKKLQRVSKRIEKAKVQVKREKTEGVLANLFKLEMQKVDLENKIKVMRLDLDPLIAAIERMEIEDDDNEFMSLH